MGNHQWEGGWSRINSTVDVASTLWPLAYMKQVSLEEMRPLAGRRVCGTAKDGRHPVWLLKPSMLRVLVEISVPTWVHVMRGEERGEAAERKGEKRQVSEHMQPKAWRRQPSEGERRAGLWDGEREGACHPILKLFTRLLAIKVYTSLCYQSRVRLPWCLRKAKVSMWVTSTLLPPATCPRY